MIPDPEDEGNKKLRMIFHGFYDIRPGTPRGILPTEVMHTADPRSKGKEFGTAREKEICGLLRSKVFHVVCRQEAGNDANVMGGRFVLSVEHVETDKILFRAIFVVQGHTDAEKNLLVNSASNIKHVSVRLIVAMADIFRYRIWTQYVAQAYLQSEQTLMGKVFIRLSMEFQLNHDELLEFFEPLYGLTDGSDH